MRFRVPGSRQLAVMMVIAAIGVLAGCREEEQGRVLLYQGAYLGTPDDSLNPDQVGELRRRALRQQP